MIRSWRSPLLAIALAAFAFQVGSAANVRCEIAAAAPASHHGGHGTHHQSGSPSGHQPGCVCVAGCSVVFRLARTETAVPRDAVRIRPACVPDAEPAEPLPLAARPFVLPLAHAPPLPA